jgi:hypothetical protein
MQTLQVSLFLIGAASSATAGLLKLYATAYAKGYEDGISEGKRCGLCGFTEIREPYRSYTRDAVGV